MEELELVKDYLYANNIVVHDTYISPISHPVESLRGSEMFRISNVIKDLDTIFGFDTSEIFKSKNILIYFNFNDYTSANLYLDLSIKEITHIQGLNQIFYNFHFGETIPYSVHENDDIKSLINIKKTTIIVNGRRDTTFDNYNFDFLYNNKKMSTSFLLTSLDLDNAQMGLYLEYDKISCDILTCNKLDFKTIPIELKHIEEHKTVPVSFSVYQDPYEHIHYTREQINQSIDINSILNEQRNEQGIEIRNARNNG